MSILFALAKCSFPRRKERQAVRLRECRQIGRTFPRQGLDVTSRLGRKGSGWKIRRAITTVMMFGA